MNKLERSLLNQLVAERKNAGISQAELGRRCGLTQQMISRIEKGHPSPKLKNFMRYVAALDLELKVAQTKTYGPFGGHKVKILTGMNAGRDGLFIGRSGYNEIRGLISTISVRGGHGDYSTEQFEFTSPEIRKKWDEWLDSDNGWELDM